MDLPDYPAITAFCRIIEYLPDEPRKTAIGFLCAALGRPADPTGIELSLDRPIRHLFWDHEAKDLYEQLVFLVERIGLKEQLAVQGAASYIVTHFALWADPEFSQSSADGFRSAIEKQRNELTYPVSQREGRRSDEDIQRFIGQLEKAIASAEVRRQSAESTASDLSSAFESAFPLQFWEALNLLGLERKLPELDDLLGGNNGDDDSP